MWYLAKKRENELEITVEGPAPSEGGRGTMGTAHPNREKNPPAIFDELNRGCNGKDQSKAYREKGRGLQEANDPRVELEPTRRSPKLVQ